MKKKKENWKRTKSQVFSGEEDPEEEIPEGHVEAVPRPENNNEVNQPAPAPEQQVVAENQEVHNDNLHQEGQNNERIENS